MEFFNTHVSEQAIKNVVEVLRSGRLSEGLMVKRFEQALADELGLLRPVALNSGTSSLHLALVLASVGPGDEVIVPPQTFVATALAVLMVGATPVFADIDPNTGNLSPESFRQHITARTRAVMPVHWAGYPCELDEINQIAANNGIAVIEDAAHALGATYKNRPIGTISRFTVFSFQAIKHLTTGDGGALCCGEAADENAARRGRWFGIDRESTAMSSLGERIYDLTTLGYKYHLNDLSAAVGLGNLEGFKIRLRRRREIAALYRQALSDVVGMTLLEAKDDREPAYWLFTMRVERRDDFVRKLAEFGIPCSVVHQRIDRHSIFGGIRQNLSGQALFTSSQISLPVHEAIEDAQIETMISVIKSGW